MLSKPSLLSIFCTESRGPYRMPHNLCETQPVESEGHRCPTSAMAILQCTFVRTTESRLRHGTRISMAIPIILNTLLLTSGHSCRFFTGPDIFRRLLSLKRYEVGWQCIMIDLATDGCFVGRFGVPLLHRCAGRPMYSVKSNVKCDGNFQIQIQIQLSTITLRSFALIILQSPKSLCCITSVSLIWILGPSICIEAPHLLAD